MAQKTIPQLNPLLGNVNENTLLPIDTGTQSFKATAKQMKDYMVADALVDIDALKASDLKSKQAIGFGLVGSLSEAAMPSGVKPIDDIIYVDAWKVFITTHRATNSADELFLFSHNGDIFYAMGETGRTTGFTKLAYNPVANQVIGVSPAASGTNVAVITYASGTFTVSYQTASFDSSNVTNGVHDLQWLPSHNAFFLVGIAAKIFKSTDGVSYTLLRNSVSPIIGGANVIEGKSGRILLSANASGQVFRSDDGGSTWTASTLSVSGVSIQSICYSKLLDRYVLAGFNGAIPASAMYSNNGESFVPCSAVNSPYPMDEYFTSGLIFFEDLGIFFGFNTMTMQLSTNGQSFKNSILDISPDGATNPKSCIGNGRIVSIFNTGIGLEPQIFKSKIYKM